MKTLDEIYIFWSSADPKSGEVFQDEVPGLIFYGYGDASWSTESVYEKFSEIWRDTHSEIKSRDWQGEGMCQGAMELKINEWPDPDKWLIYLEASLRSFVEAGALISWCGDENSSPALEALNPGNDSGSVYAAYSDKGGFIYASGLCDDYKELDDEDLKKIGPSLETEG